MITRHVVTTETGSRYTILEHEGGQFTLVAENVATLLSKAVDPNREWPILRPYPWPLVQGQRMVLMPPDSIALDFGHPDRMPGGGKITSLIMSVVIVTED